MKLFDRVASLFRRKPKIPAAPMVRSIKDWAPQVRSVAAPKHGRRSFSSKLQRRAYRVGRCAHYVRGGGL